MGRVKFNSKKYDGLRPLDFSSHEDITIKYFIQLFEQFMEEKALEGLTERTLCDHEKHFRYFKNFILKYVRSDINHDSINSKIFVDYKDYMINIKKYKPHTVNIRIGSLKVYLNWLYKKKYTNDNYSLYISKIKVDKDTIQPLTKKEIKKMLNTCDTSIYSGLRDLTIMVTILDTGIRIQELCNCTTEDVDIKNKLLLVRAQNAKSRKFRHLPLSRESTHLLKKMIEISNINGSPYLFMSSHTSKKLDHNVVINNFRKYGEKAGINKRCTPHVWRHTFAVNAVRKGMDLFTLQKIMGHENITTTRQYIQLNTSDLVKKHNEINILKDFLK